MEMCKERECALNVSLGDALNDAKEAMELANRCGNISATVHFAERINQIEDIVDGYVEMYQEDADLMGG